MDESKFWSLIEASKKESNGSCGIQLKILSSKLAELPEEGIIEFNKILDKMFGLSYTWELWAAAYIINGGCSDDCFTYFRGWLIAQGEIAFYNALKDPETLDYIEDGEDVECQHVLNVAEWAYEKKTGSDTIPFRVRKFWFDEEISGSEWDEDTVDAKYPKLAAKFSE